MGVWMLELTAGPTWRFASSPAEWDGAAYVEGLEVSDDHVDAVSLSEPTELAKSFSLHGDAVAALDLESVALGATAKVYYWTDPTTGDPTLLLSGTVEDPVYGSSSEPLTATVREVPWLDRGAVIPATAAINGDTWPSADAGLDDEVYPVIVGAPGATSVMGSPAYLVDTGAGRSVLVAGHPVVAPTVRIHDLTGATSNLLNVSTVADGLGRSVAIADGSAWGALAAGDELWAVWQTDGGLANPESPSSALTGAGDVIEWLLHRSTLRVDWGRLRAAKARLNAYKIDTYIQGAPGEPVSPWRWISSHLLPLLPVSVRTGPKGLYLAVFDPGAPLTEARIRLEEGRNCDRISPVSTLGVSDVANDFSLTYAPRSDGDKGASIVRVSGDRATLDAFPSAFRSAICEESRRRFGRIGRHLATTAIYDASTATRLLLSMAARDALPAREVVYALRDGHGIEGLEPGDSVRLVDDGLGWSARSAYVWSVRLGTPVEVALRLWHRPGRDLRVTG